ncbi:glycosyltransferase family 4 protein [Bailinhaonella thermotolerans]|uniref:Glycosyltransferase family 1 protein n=1 Tax=Bailinhaonella thermotolerans TaxID=1070861 RepID=A0A3A4B9K7_9ACTN|nr:glycosyltransferase family 4 protein [Bailinhaonella thermotolerans]RJL30868.1 glycosyltransferase family 1 protein [Bailinhaonella thermotolerans]
MTRLRVANVITKFTAGAGLVALQGALGLDPDEYEVTFIAGADSVDGESGAAGALDVVRHGAEAVKHAPEHDMIGDAFEAGMPVIQVPALVTEISRKADPAALRLLTTILAEGRYDVVHTHSPKAGLLGRVAAARAGTPRIVHTWHGFPFHQFMPWWRRQIYIRAERYASRHTDAFLAVGKQIAIEAMRLGLTNAERVRVIDSVAEPAEYASGNAARARARSELGLPPGARVVGTVGRIAFAKGPDTFVKALAQLPADVHGVWVGDGPDRESAMAMARKAAVQDRLVWTGYRRDVASLLPAFDVFALSSNYEGVPCVLGEAMLAGLPVVATTVNGVPDVVVPGQTGLLTPPARPDLFAEALRFMLGHPQEARRMAEAGRLSIGDRFSGARLARTLDETYHGRSQRPAPAKPRTLPPVPEEAGQTAVRTG